MLVSRLMYGIIAPISSRHNAAETDRPLMDQPGIPSIPYACQFASRELVRDFLEEGRPLESDPAWQTYGAQSPAEYAHWALRSCGVVCVKMAVEGLAGLTPRPVMEWVQAPFDKSCICFCKASTGAAGGPRV